MLKKNGPAQLEYGDATFTVVAPGAYVVCAITGKEIQIDDLSYWSVLFQEPYADAAAAHQALSAKRKS